jgi:hypothetical protein
MTELCPGVSVSYDPAEISDLRHDAEDAHNRLYDCIISNLYAQEGQIRILERQNRELRNEVARLEGVNGKLG